MRKIGDSRGGAAGRGALGGVEPMDHADGAERILHQRIRRRGYSSAPGRALWPAGDAAARRGGRTEELFRRRAGRRNRREPPARRTRTSASRARPSAERDPSTRTDGRGRAGDLDADHLRSRERFRLCAPAQAADHRMAARGRGCRGRNGAVASAAGQRRASHHRHRPDPPSPVRTRASSVSTCSRLWTLPWSIVVALSGSVVSSSTCAATARARGDGGRIRGG